MIEFVPDALLKLKLLATRSSGTGKGETETGKRPPHLMALRPSAALLARTISVAGYQSCGFARRALARAHEVLDAGFVDSVDDRSLFAERDEYLAWLATDRQSLFEHGPRQALAHTSSPLVWVDDNEFIGGCDNFLVWADAQTGDGAAAAAAAAAAGSPSSEAEDIATRLSSHGLSATFDGSLDAGDQAFLKHRSPTQFMVLRRGATDDRAATEAKGGFDDTWTPDAEYVCGACSSPLYTSAMKFDCGCGWPGFFRCVDGAVFARPDGDGVRHEIVCSSCDSHLGHVFFNEGFDGMECDKSGNTVDTNHRHCVNSSSLTLKHADGRLQPSAYRGPVFQSASRTADNPDARTGQSMMAGEWLEGRDEIPGL